jgi:hypothetical protein
LFKIDESLLIYYIESAANFKEKYNDSGFTTEVVTDYPEKLATLDKANKSIQQLRENNNNYKNRQQFYQQLSPHLDKLSEIVAIFEQSAPLIANKQQDKDRIICYYLSSKTAVIIFFFKICCALYIVNQ